MRSPGRMILALLFSFAAIGSAQPVVVGQLRSKAESTVTLPSGPLTLVDLSTPASISGEIRSVTVQWVGSAVAPCSPGIKLKFFRPVASGGALAYLGERGPFAMLGGLIVIPISPPVNLQAHDLIGVTEFGNAICGGVGITDTGSGLNTATFVGDIRSDTTLGQASTLLKSRMSIQGIGGGSEVRTGIIPVALSTPGLNGSFFRTGLQMTNPGPNRISGRLVFHPQGKSGSPTDPSLSYTLAPSETRGYADVVAAIGESGSGSLDLYSSASPPPLIVTRVFNDAGSAGTSGFTESTVAPEDALQAFDSARLATPADPVNFRMNIGIRTLSAGTSLRVTLYSSSGTVLVEVTRGFPAEDFEQVSAAALLGVASIGANQTISIEVNTGSAIVYAATADNRTNDPSMQLGNRDDF